MSLNQGSSCRIGIIGAGRIGKLHAENIKRRLPQFELAAIVDPQLNYAWAKGLGISTVGTDEDLIFENNNIDAVLIASPSHLHISQLARASHAGKAIFCEKPLGLSEEEIIEAISILKNNKTLLQLGFNRRFDPSFAHLQQQIAAGEIGSPQLLNITSRDPACPSKEYCATSGGLFSDMTIHDFDMARFLMQSEVVEVYAMGSLLINPELEEFNDIDTAIIQLRFTNGALGVINNSRQAVYGYDQRIEVLGAKGLLLADNSLRHSISHYAKEQTHFANPKHFFLERYEHAFLAELAAFYQSWIEQKPATVTAFDGLQALRLAQAANLSRVRNQPVILEKEFDDAFL